MREENVNSALLGCDYVNGFNFVTSDLNVFY